MTLGGLGSKSLKGLGGIGKSSIGTLGKGKGPPLNTGIFGNTSKISAAPAKTDNSAEKLAEVISASNACLVESMSRIAKKNEEGIGKIIEYLEHMSSLTLQGFTKLIETEKSEEGAPKSLEIIIQNLDEQVSMAANKAFVIIPGHESDAEEEVDIDKLLEGKDVSVCANISDVVKLVGNNWT
jgi:hypothetical protein